MTRRHVYCLGPVVLDRFVTVDRIPGPDDKAFVKAKRETAGGPPRNVATALAGWGEAVSIASVVGGDGVGQALIARLADAGIGTEAIDVLPDMETATALVIVEASGERAILIEPVADAALAAIGGSLRPAPGDAVIANLFHGSATADALARARAAGALAVLDLEWPEIERWGWPAALAAAAAADIVTSNGQVVAQFARSERIGDPLRARQMLAATLDPSGGRVCVTLGAGGVLARHGAAVWHTPALPVSPTDTTGAGDRFLAALVRASLNGRPFDRAVLSAIVAAGLFLSATPHRWADVEAMADALDASAAPDLIAS